MKLQTTYKHISIAIVLSAASAGIFAATKPAQVPLMSAAKGAVPNVVISIDNSGSMFAHYLDSDTQKISQSHFGARSYDINKMYYNPTQYYEPRLVADGVNYTTPDRHGSSSDCRNCANRSSWAANNKLTFLINWDDKLRQNRKRRRNFDRHGQPYHTEYTDQDYNKPTTGYFLYKGANGKPVKIYINKMTVNGAAKSILGVDVVGHKRTDCKSASGCTRAEEMRNIVRWYNFYSSRIKAVTTSIGNALAQDKLTNKLRVGYNKMHRTQNDDISIDGGVRLWSGSGKQAFYDWLYEIRPSGMTPSHDTINRVGAYYMTDEPWRGTDKKGFPRKTNSAKDLTCRRAYHIFLSDGGWNDMPTGPDSGKWVGSVNKDKENSQSFKRKGKSSFSYSKSGGSSKGQYIPYSGGQAENGLADLTAYYFWQKDLSPRLKNEVVPIPSRNNPTFWQNMISYHMGWGLSPQITTGYRGNYGFTWKSLNDYKRTWLSGNPVTPNWNSGDFSANASQNNVNDFIRAGYTGGGESFSVFSADDVRKAMDTILSQITGSGSDAGVAVSSGGNATDNLEDELRYSVTYDTASNGGAIEAYKLNAKKVNGKKIYSVGDKDWTASVNPVASRKLYALSKNRSNIIARQELNAGTRLDSLPGDLQTLLNSNNKQKPDSSFIKYILGKEGVADKNGKLYRSRNSAIGASVNSPPAFVGSGLDMGYSSLDDKKVIGEKIKGKDKYKAYLDKKGKSEATIFAATNEGIVHVITSGKAAKGGGKEVAAYMPKGAMAHQTALADSGFQFKYVLDGPLAVDDVYGDSTTATAAAWHQVVTGTGGRGGKYIYAINSPLNKADKKRTPNKENFLWEVSSADTGYGDMGYITNLSTSGQLRDGTWVTLVNSGHYADKGRPVGLYVINALNGKLKGFISIPKAYYEKGNRGLGGVVAVHDKARRIVAAYAGDANGNVWRFDLRSVGNNANKEPSYGKPLFTTGKKQPIYAAPAWQVHPLGGVIVNVATGILLEEDDIKKQKEDNAIYGLWDPTPIGGNDLKPEKLKDFRDGKFTIEDADLFERKLVPTVVGTDSAKNKYYKITGGDISWTDVKTEKGNTFKANRGWKLELGKVSVPNVGKGGERVIGDLHYVGSGLVVPSVFIPNEEEGTNITESCESEGLTNMLYVIDAVTGKPTRFFTQYQASAVFLPGGGFTRGLAVRRTNDSDSLSQGKSNHGNIDGEPKECSPGQFAIVGAGGIMQGEIECASGWTRTWRSIMKPPF